MSSFQDAVHKLSEWLKNEDNQQIVLKESLSFVMNRIMIDLGIIEAIIYFNIECDRKGKENVLNKLEKIPDFLLASHYFLSDSDLVIDKLQILSNLSTHEFLSIFKGSKKAFNKLSIRELLSSSPYDLSYSIFRNIIVVKSMDIDACDYQNTLETLSMCCDTLKVNKINNNNILLTITVPENAPLRIISLPEQIEYISKECFSKLTHPIDVFINNKVEISFQRGSFNHNINHLIHIPKGTQVRCHKEDMEYLKNHIQRY